MKKSTFLAFLFFIGFQAFGSIYAPSFRNITIENKLANNTVRCITKDADGFIWFGTLDGLCRYDGISIKTYRRENEENEDNENALVYNSISALYSNSKGKLFVGTQKGLCQYVRNKEIFLPVSYKEFD